MSLGLEIPTLNVPDSLILEIAAKNPTPNLGQV
jgi:hypothetical protein